MDFFEKLDVLHANSVSPKKIKNVTGDSKDEVLQKVMDFVDKFDAKQKRLEKRETGTVMMLKPNAASLDMKKMAARARQIGEYAARYVRAGQTGRAGMAGKSKRVGDVTFKFKKTKDGLIVVDKVGRKAAFVVRPEQLAGVEGSEGKSVRRKLKNGRNGGPKGGDFGRGLR